jgi:uncharacterized protein
MLRSVLLCLLCLPFACLAQQRVFDMHVHLHEGAKSLQSYEADAKAAKLALSGFGAMWFGGPNHALAGDPAKIRAGNDGLLALAAKHPRMLPIATVHPYDGQAAFDELQRVAGKGMKVLKIHPHTQRFDAADPRVLALVRRAGELGMVVLMDNAAIVPDDVEELFDLALKAPKTRFVFAHIGGMEFRFWNILAMARTAEGLFADNIFFDLSATVTLMADSPLEEEFVWTLRNVGIERLLLGSDYPQFSLQRNVDALERLDLTAEEKAKIRHGNAARLFGL